MRYVLYEGQNGDMLFTKEELVKANPNLLQPFEKKSPTLVIDAANDNEAIQQLNTIIMSRNQKK